MIQRGNTISRIAGQIYGDDRMVLGIDLLKEYNPRIEDLTGSLRDSSSRFLLSREKLCCADNRMVAIILFSIHSLNAQEAAELSQAVRLKGYAVAITPRKVFGNLLVHRVAD
ncbi:MAG: hypothetical protein ACREQP_03890 [Candidatus Binatia bacterium]